MQGVYLGPSVRRKAKSALTSRRARCFVAYAFPPEGLGRARRSATGARRNNHTPEALHRAAAGTACKAAGSRTGTLYPSLCEGLPVYCVVRNLPDRKESSGLPSNLTRRIKANAELIRQFEMGVSASTSRV